jgi:hypothetical protein
MDCKPHARLSTVCWPHNSHQKQVIALEVRVDQCVFAAPNLAASESIRSPNPMKLGDAMIQIAILPVVLAVLGADPLKGGKLLSQAGFALASVASGIELPRINVDGFPSTSHVRSSGRFCGGRARPSTHRFLRRCCIAMRARGTSSDIIGKRKLAWLRNDRWLVVCNNKERKENE